MRNLVYISVGLICTLLIIFIFKYSTRTPTAKYMEILTADEMKAKYNITSDGYKPPPLDPEKIPKHLRDLLPMAAKWGISDDIIRDDFEQKASDTEKQEFKKALTGRNADITKWLDSFNKDELMPDEAACFMYMQLGLDEMGLWPDHSENKSDVLME